MRPTVEDKAARKQGAGPGADDPQVHTRRARGRPINRSAAEVDFQGTAKRALAQSQVVKIVGLTPPHTPRKHDA